MTALARATDPGTSRAAGQSVEASPNRVSLMERIDRYLIDHPGRTAGEIADALNEPYSRIWRRCSDLLNAGQVYRSGARVWPGSGRAQGILYPASLRNGVRVIWTGERFLPTAGLSS